MKSLQKVRLIPTRLVSTINTPLVSDPLSFSNTRKVRDTKTRFPKPNFVSFDAFGTLYTPKAPIHIQYHQIASTEFGIDKLPEAIQESFGAVHDELALQYPNYGKNSEISTPDQWWLELIVKVFDIPHYREDSTSRALCDRLIASYKSSEGYRMYDDVVPTLSQLKLNGVRIVISSNSDPRVYDILRSFGVAQYIEPEDVYVSYDLDCKKPEKRFFDLVAQAQIRKSTGGALNSSDRASYLSNAWHVGDTHTKDYVGAVKAGWNGVFLDRDVESLLLTETIPDPEAGTPSCITKPDRKETIGTESKPAQIIANNRVVISDLTQLLTLFKLDA